MQPQGVLGFQYEAERSSAGLTSLAGLPVYLDLVHSSGLAAAIRRHVQVAGTQGWLDIQMTLALIFLNLAGGDCMEDLERLEQDDGFAAALQLYSEFRDGNVPAGHEQLRVLKDCLRYLPMSVTKLLLRSDTAGYQEELLLYCGEGKDLRFGVIDFAIGADVTEAFRAAVLATAEAEWKPLIRMFDGKPQETDQEWAEVCYVPNWAGHSRNRADYRFLAIREPLRQLPLGDEAQLPFPTQEFGRKGVYKLFGVVTNLKCAGDQVTPAFAGASLVAARALRQERGSPFGDEERPRRRATAPRIKSGGRLWSVRRQRGMVGLDDPGP